MQKWFFLFVATFSFHVIAVASTERPMQLIVDTDMGQDDIMGLISLLNKPHIDVKAITVSGTGIAHANGGLHTLRALLAFLQKDIPTAAGTEVPLEGSQSFPTAWRLECDHLLDHLNIDVASQEEISAVALLQKTIEAADEKVTILALGPMTNLALLFRSFPHLTAKVERIHIMGGAIDVTGNLFVVEGNRVAEWNIYADPLAAREVLQTGIPTTWITLDLTNQTPLTHDFYAYARANSTTAAAKLFCDILSTALIYIDISHYCLWDLLAVETLAEPTLANYETRCIDIVIEEGPYYGQTVSCPDGYEIQFGKKTDYDRFVRLYFDTINHIKGN